MQYDYDHVVLLLEVVERAAPSKYPGLKIIHDQAMQDLLDIANPPTEEELERRAAAEKAAEDAKAKKIADAKAEAEKAAEEKAKADELAAKGQPKSEPETAPPTSSWTPTPPVERRV